MAADLEVLTNKAGVSQGGNSETEAKQESHTVSELNSSQIVSDYTGYLTTQPFE